MKHKKVFVIAACLAALAAASAMVITVLAYFTDGKNLTNTVTVNDNTIEISEVFEPQEQKTGDNIYKKEITVVNTGNTPVYVRVYADFSSGEIRSRSYFSNSPEKEGARFYSAERDLTGNTYCANLETQAPDWYFVPDDSESPLRGFYYYNKALEGGETTPPLLTWIKTVNSSVADIKQYDVIVYAESTQLSSLKTGKNFESYRKAWEECLAED